MQNKLQKSMKKGAALLMTAAMAGMTLSACGASSQEATETENTDDKIQIVTTIFPEYDWVKQIVGENNDNVELTLLLDDGVDMHSFQPTAADMLTISNSDLFIYVGGESDEWVEDALEGAVNSDMKSINLLETLGDAAKEEEVIEGMEAEEEHDHDEEDHDHEAEDHDHEEEEAEYDEHVWLSFNNAKLFTETIADTLSEIDEEHAEEYQQNLADYTAKLDELVAQYQDAVNEASQTTILFGDRFPFRYLVDDYNIDYYAAFVGCSAETEASFSTITFLAEKMDELDLDTIFVLENSEQKLAQTIIDNTEEKDQKILTIDSMQSTTIQQAEEGATYISLMESNLEVLKEAMQ